MRMTSAVLTLLVLAVAIQARGAIITPISVTPSSEFAPASNLIDGSGLDPLGLHDNNENNMWQTFNLATGTSIGETVEFELDQNYDLSDAIVWQYNGLNGFGLPELDRELDEVQVAVSPDLVSPFTTIGSFNMDPAVDQTSLVGEPAQIFALSGASNVRRVQFTILSVQGGVDDGTAGLSEVRFAGSVVPEPASLLLLITGGLAFCQLRRRKLQQ